MFNWLHLQTVNIHFSVLYFFLFFFSLHTELLGLCFMGVCTCLHNKLVCVPFCLCVNEHFGNVASLFNGVAVAAID